MNEIPIIKLYGAQACHKTKYYQLLLDKIKLPYQFLDVESNKDHAAELRGLYENGKLNFPTITIGSKKIRNPTKEDLDKWLNKLIPIQPAVNKDDMESNSLLGQIKKLPVGYSEVSFQTKKYGVSRTDFNNGRSHKIFAQELGGKDFISLNYYVTRQGGSLKPCEMPEEKVIDFLNSYLILLLFFDKTKPCLLSRV